MQDDVWAQANFVLTFSSFHAFRRVPVHEPAVTPHHRSQERMATFLPVDVALRHRVLRRWRALAARESEQDDVDTGF